MTGLAEHGVEFAGSAATLKLYAHGVEVGQPTCHSAPQHGTTNSAARVRVELAQRGVKLAGSAAALKLYADGVEVGRAAHHSAVKHKVHGRVCSNTPRMGMARIYPSVNPGHHACQNTDCLLLCTTNAGASAPCVERHSPCQQLTDAAMSQCSGHSAALSQVEMARAPPPSN